MTLYILDLLGIFVFALSGAIVAQRREYDLFGGVVLAIVTSIGGGTLRDLVLGHTPIFWLNDIAYVSVATIAAVIYFLLIRVYQFGQNWKQLLDIADAAGLALFTIIGVDKALDASIQPAMAVLMGVVTGVVGGITRDVLAHRAPLIFRSDLYATASIVGGASYVIATQVGAGLALSAGIGVSSTFILRILAVYLGWGLPVFKRR